MIFDEVSKTEKSPLGDACAVAMIQSVKKQNIRKKNGVECIATVGDNCVEFLSSDAKVTWITKCHQRADPFKGVSNMTVSIRQLVTDSIVCALNEMESRLSDCSPGVTPGNTSVCQSRLVVSSN